MFVRERFKLDPTTVGILYDMVPNFGYDGFGEFLFYRTYSRTICDKCRIGLKYNKDLKKDYCINCGFDFRMGQENWADCVRRVVEGTFSIRKDWYVKCNIPWDESFWQHYAQHFAISMFKMEWLPPGRGLWAMGTDYIFNHGSMALYNCAYISIIDIPKSIHWLMDCLMNGVGTGFNPVRDDDLEIYNPVGQEDFIIEDSREGWCDSVEAKINSFIKRDQKNPRFIYDQIRKKGLPIRGFGGIASGPEPLMLLHQKIEEFFDSYACDDWYDSVLLKTDLANSVGCTVISGNVRRCLPKTTVLSTYNGLKNIDKIRVNDQVLTVKGYKKVKNVFKQGIQKLIRVHLTSNRWIDCTPNHKFAIVDSLHGNIDWVEAQYLNENDSLLLQQVPNQGKDFNLDLAYFYGVLNGDGNVHDRRNEGVGTDLTIVFSKDEQGNASCERIKKYLEFNLNLNPKISNVHNNYYKLRVYDTDFALSMLPYKIPNQAPVIPDAIFEASVEARASYLAGLCDADGSVKKYVICSSSYIDFLRQVQRIAISLGIDTYIHTRPERMKDKNGDYYKSENILVIRGFIAKKHAARLINPYMTKQFPEITQPKGDSFIQLKFAQTALQEGNITNEQYSLLTCESKFGRGERNPIHKNLIDLNPDFWTKVYPVQVQEIIELDEEQETWDIEVEDEHCFFAEGILVHNSAELSAGDFDDPVFMDMKDYSKYPYRAGHGFMSNNSVILDKDSDFENLGEIAKRVISNGEPGFLNKRNLPKGRIGKGMDGLRLDEGIGLNPCGEIILEDAEVCNLAKTFPTVCQDSATWLRACEYATVYCTSVSLLPTHRPETNRIVAKNRRIGVDLQDFTGWKQQEGLSKVIRLMREGYNKVVAVAKWLNDEAGVPTPVRHTTVAPGGTVPKLPGRTSGVGYPNFHHTLRRVRLGKDSPVCKLLIDANIPFENDVVSANTWVFEWPILQGPAKPSSQVSVWEQAFNLITMQREWADNAVSNTLNFRPKWVLDKDLFVTPDNHILDEAVQVLTLGLGEGEHILGDGTKKVIIKPGEFGTEIKIYNYDPLHEEDVIEDVLAAIAPLTKSVSMLPQTAKGVYKQMPEEGITEEEYNRRLASIKKIDWSKLKGSDGVDEKFCTADSCVTQ